MGHQQTFDKRILGYSFSGLIVGNELEKLFSSRNAQLREATILYAARLLESLSASALDRIGEEYRENCFSNLETLRFYGVIPDDTASLSHSLRRIGNQIRHAAAEADRDTEEAAVAFLEIWLRWFFCRFPFGPGVEDLFTSPGEPPSRLSPVISRIETLDMHANAILREIMQNSPDFDAIISVASIAAVLAEKLLNYDHLEPSVRVLDLSLDRHPGDLRLLQLKGLYLSRSGQLEKAVELLDPLYARNKNDDETSGIIAGVYKRLWKRTGDDAWLGKSYRAYRSGWLNDRNNTYLGINLATIALVMGKNEESFEVANRVKEVLERKITFLERHEGDSKNGLNLWDRLTMAEAEMLLGNRDVAARIFAQARDMQGSATGALRTSLEQMKMIQSLSGMGDIFDP